MPAERTAEFMSTCCQRPFARSAGSQVAVGVGYAGAHIALFHGELVMRVAGARVVQSRWRKVSPLKPACTFRDDWSRPSPNPKEI